MNLYKSFHADLMKALEVFPVASLHTDRITAEPPKEANHGDLSTNAAMILSKPMNMSPKAMAEKIIPLLKDLPFIEHIHMAGPGFINITFEKNFWIDQLRTILHEKDRYGHVNLGQNEPLNIEYVSTNPTGPMHLGHCRGAIFGDILATLMERVGYKVTREFYINDAGAQVMELARSLHARYCHVLGKEKPLGTYKGDYLIPIAKDMAHQYKDKFVHEPESVWLDTFKTFAVQAMMKQIKEDLACLNIHHDVFVSEKELVEAKEVDHTLMYLKEQGLIYEGILDPPKGKVIEDYEPHEQTLFKSTQYGDDCDRPLKKSDGSWTYFANDIAYHYNKYKRGFKNLINIWGADHGGYVKRLKAAIQCMTQDQAHLHVHLCQMVRFLDEGMALKMSKRQGVFVTVSEAIHKVGRDALRFLMVWRKNDAPMDFDFQKAIEASKDNPVFYVQYAHARICSVKRHAASLFGAFEKEPDLTWLDDDDRHLIKTLALWPRILETAARTQEPHRVAYYMYDVAGAFHSLWTRGKEKSDLRFIHADKNITHSRLALLEATQTVLKAGLFIMGVEPLDEMIS